MRERTSEIAAFLAAMYESYGILNRICWQGTLPPSLLRMSHRLSRHTGAYAQDRGGGEYRIVFNAVHCRRLDDSAFLQIMAHEMIHIWQYSSGRRGGHGRDFRKEALRLGVEQVRGSVISPTSPMGYVFFMHDLKNLHPAEAARQVAAYSDHRRFEIEFYQAAQRYFSSPRAARGGV